VLQIIKAETGRLNICHAGNIEIGRLWRMALIWQDQPDECMSLSFSFLSYFAVQALQFFFTPFSTVKQETDFNTLWYE
jgi:hypothetical protein